MSRIAMLGLAILPAVSIMILGCAGNLPESQRVTFLQDNWGRSVQSANSNQTLNPTAGLTREPVEGMDGRTGGLATEKYRRTFSIEKEVDPIDRVSPVFTITPKN
ncbi:hypothetical protein [Desulfonatronum lacustre]|uniref:hypothetical protein n=1 Tax=Desulfonatronum lacustre TaxID=66849 RepID=UPI0004B61F0F|nr:hypothetical protein [Desulfonatronum lacustre]